MAERDDYGHISPEEFAKLDYGKYTLLDLREPDEVLISGIEGAINLPFSGGFDKLDTIPKDKPIIAYCRVGDWSEQIAEILSERGYDISTLDGGYTAYRKYLSEDSQDDPIQAAEDKINELIADFDELADAYNEEYASTSAIRSTSAVFRGSSIASAAFIKTLIMSEAPLCALALIVIFLIGLITEIKKSGRKSKKVRAAAGTEEA